MEFDNLVFDYGWRKPVTICFQRNIIKVDLVLDAYEGEEQTQEQQLSAKNFFSAQANYEAIIDKLVQEYIKKNNISSPTVTANTLFINREGEIALLCDCSWDTENGIAVVVYPDQFVTVQDNFI